MTGEGRRRYGDGVDAAASTDGSRGRRRAVPRARELAGRLTAPGRDRTGAAFALLLLASVTAFARVAEDYVTGDPLVRWDVRFAIWLHERATAGLVDVFQVLTFAGNAVVLGVLVLALATLFARRGRPVDGLVLMAALGGAGIGNALLKLVFQRHRPEIAFLNLDTYSFPSGHAAAASATFTVLAYLLARGRPRNVQVGLGLAAFALIALVDFSRLYLGVHYLSDVLAGTSVGLAWASACLLVLLLAGEARLARLLPRRLRG